MCGITGIIHPEKQRSVDGAILRSMNTSLSHRGPDDEGYWVRENVGLAMRRLSIIDLDGGHQPISNESGSVWTVFNGEIYNFQELRDEMIQKGHRFRTKTDTEVIVHLYEEMGEMFVHKLRGMFAIALWDGDSRNFYLYRDRVGIKPLHYWFQDGTLVFGSEIKAILCYPDIDTELSLSAISDYLSFLYIPTPKTIYRDIHKLPAGNFLRYKDGNIEIVPYWDFSFEIDYKLTEKKWVEKLRWTLEETVRLHLLSDVPVGAFLSGGMDSSTIVAWMSRKGDTPSRTYSMGFHDSRFNELPYAREVARRFKTEHHEYVVEVDAFELLPRIISGFDEPFADSSAIPTYLVCEFARRDVTVALSGDGGDELFGGYQWTQKQDWIQKYQRTPLFLKKLFERYFSNAARSPLRETGFKSILERFFYDAAKHPSESYARRAMNFQPWMKKELFHPAVYDGLGAEPSLEFVRSFYDRDSAQSVLDKLLYLDSKIYLPDDLLTKVDRMSMLHSLEVRVPFLDHKLVELACSIPFSLKQKGFTTKYILKKAMKGLLPDNILKQRKQGFSIPVDGWFRNELSRFASSLLLGESCISRRYFRPQYIKWMLEEHTRGRQRFGAQIYALVLFELWCRLCKKGANKQITNLALKDMI